MALRASDLRVRMYRVGFGDCFLISFPVDPGHRHVLVDFGVHPNGDIGTLEDVLRDLQAETGKQLSLVVATHEHADHISGFARFSRELSRFHVGEVWMPWALDPDDAQATTTRQQRLTLAETLAAHFNATGGAPDEVSSALVNLRGNDTAVQALRSGFGLAGARVRYLEPGPGLRSLGDIEGLGLRVLAPARDEAFLRQMEPPASQRFLRLDRGIASPANAIRPFPDRWTWKDRVAARHDLGFPAQEEKDLEDLGDAAADLALAVNRIVNNTSLVLLFEFRGQKLLFAGDAQWGNWRSWLDREDSSGLLSQVSFLKVAHHGSHNATPRRVVEGLKAGRCVAMVSTQNHPWPSIPQEALLTALEKRTRGRVARSDVVPHAGAPVAEGPAADRVSAPFHQEAGEVWIDWLTQI